MFIRSILIALVASALLGGCGAIVGGTIDLANRSDQAAARSKHQEVRARQIEYMRTLQAHGDPMGDYLFALANAENWIGANRISDPIAIRDLYKAAAEKGSSDAMIALGLMLFDGRGAPQYADGIYLPREQQDFNMGLKWIEKGMSIRCSYAQPLVNGQCIAFRSPAGWIWPAFRDGRSRRNADGSFTKILQPDADQARYWQDKDAACEISREVMENKKNCRP